MKNVKVFKVIALSVMLGFCSTAALSGGGGITGGATEWTQLMNNSELAVQVTQLTNQINNQITQIINQVTQITNQVTMIQDMILNTMELPGKLFGSVMQIYSRIKGLMDKTKGIVYSMQNLDEEMKKRFQSYASMSSLSTTKDFQQEYRKITDTQMETVRTTLEAIGVSYEQLEKDDTKALEQLQELSKTAAGRNAIGQSTNQFLSFLGEEALKLRQIVMMQAQMTGVALEAERAKQDAAQKRHEESLMNLKNPFEGLDNADFSPLKW